MKIGKEELDEIIELSGHDVRQTIYNLQMRSKGVGAKINQKDMAVVGLLAVKFCDFRAKNGVLGLDTKLAPGYTNSEILTTFSGCILGGSSSPGFSYDINGKAGNVLH